MIRIQNLEYYIILIFDYFVSSIDETVYEIK